MLVIWMILDKVDEVFQLEQVDQLVEVDEIEQEDEVYMKWINWIKWLQNWPKLQSMATMCLSEYLMVERPENLEKIHFVPQRVFRWRCPFEEKNIFLIFGFDAKIVGVCAAWNVACRRIAPPATLQTNFPTKYASAKNTASIIIKRQAWARFSEFCWFLIKISLIGERQCTKTNVWVFLSGGSGRHDLSW